MFLFFFFRVLCSWNKICRTISVNISLIKSLEKERVFFLFSAARKPLELKNKLRNPIKITERYRKRKKKNIYKNSKEISLSYAITAIFFFETKTEHKTEKMKREVNLCLLLQVEMKKIVQFIAIIIELEAIDLVHL